MRLRKKLERRTRAINKPSYFFVKNYIIDDSIDMKIVMIDWLTKANEEFKHGTDIYMTEEAKKKREDFSECFEELIEFMKYM